MKFMKIMLMIVATSLVAACSTTGSNDESIQKAASAFCKSALPIYQAYVIADIGSDQQKATVDAAYLALSPYCGATSQITAADLPIMAAQVYIMVKAAKSQAVKA